MSRLRKPTPALVVAAAAVAIAGTGGAVAAGLVTSAQIKNDTIQGIDVKNGTLKPRDLAASAKSRAWHASSYRNIALPADTTRNVAYMTIDSPAAGFVAVNASFAVRVRNSFDAMSTPDCRVSSQISPESGVMDAINPNDAIAPGFADQWVNGNLPTEYLAGTYLQLGQSTNRVVPIHKGVNRIYLVGRHSCAAVIWGPINMTATYVTFNPPATMTPVES